MKLIYIFIGMVTATISLATNQYSKTEFLTSVQHDIEFYQSHLRENNPHKLSEGLINKLHSLNNVLSQMRAEKELSLELKKSLKLAHVDIQHMIGKIHPEFEIRVPTEAQTEWSSGTQTGTIRGRVLDSVQGTTIEDGSIILYDSTGSYVSTTYTDSIGRYFFSDVNVGNYLIAGKKTGYETQFYNGVLCPGGLGSGCALNDVNMITVEANETTNQIDFNLQKNGTIVGKVVDQETSQNLSANIYVYDENLNYINSFSTNYNSGEFIVALEAGSYYLKFEYYGYLSELYNNQRCWDECDFSQAEILEVTLGGEVSIGTINLLKHRPFGGRVLDLATGDPLFIDNYSQRVEVVDADSGYVQGATNYAGISSDGVWQVNGIAPGNYKVRSRVIGYLAQYNSLRNCSGSEFNQCDDSLANVFNHQSISGTLNVNFRHKHGGKISGRVYHTDSNGSISAKVYLYDHNGNQVASTNSSGENFSFSGLANGNYYISAKLNYYSNNSYLPTIRPSSYCQLNDGDSTCLNPTDGSVITISSYAHVQNQNIRLKPAGKLTGVIKDSSNLPIQSARIELWYMSNYPYYYSIDTAYTDAQGRYTLENLTLSDYFITASKSEYVTEIFNNQACSEDPCNATFADEISITNGETFGDYNFNLTNKAKLTFSLTTPTNIEVGGTINVYKNNGQSVGSYHVDDGGSEIYLSAGSYRFQYSGNNMASKPYGGLNCYDNCSPLSGNLVTISNNNNYHYTMQVDALFKIYGDIDDPLSHYKRVKLYRNNEIIQSQYVYGNTYEIYVKTPGQVKVGINEAGFYSSFYNNVECENLSCALSQANPLTTGVNGSRKIDLVMKPLIQISGKVVNEQGTPISGIRVDLHTEDSYIGGIYTDQNGGYVYQVEAAGTYYLVTGSNDSYVNTLYGNVACENMACEVSSGNPITVDIGDNLNGIDITAREKGGFNINQVKYIDGTTAANLRIEFFDAVTHYLVNYTSTDSEGNIEGLHLPSGNYILRSNSRTYPSSYYTAYPNYSCDGLNETACLNLGEQVNITLGNSTDVNGFQVHKKGGLSFYITAEDNNEPIVDAKVTLYDEDFNAITFSYSDDNGIVEFTSLNDDNVYAFIEANSASRYRSSLYDGIVCVRGVGIDCLLSAGSLIEITDNTDTQIDTNLTSKPSVLINAVDSVTHSPISTQYKVYSLSGNLVTSNNQQNFEHVVYLNEGEYYLLMNQYNYNLRYANTAYPDTRCGTVNYLTSCPSGYGIIQVSATNNGSFTTEMEIYSGISGHVMDKSTGEPMGDVILDFWRNYSYPYHSGSTVTGANGSFSKYLDDSSYFISTDLDSHDGFINQVYPNVVCMDGPVILDQCDINLGNIVTVEDYEVSTVIFELFEDVIFNNGFN